MRQPAVPGVVCVGGSFFCGPSILRERARAISRDSPVLLRFLPVAAAGCADQENGGKAGADEDGWFRRAAGLLSARACSLLLLLSALRTTSSSGRRSRPVWRFSGVVVVHGMCSRGGGGDGGGNPATVL